MKYYALPVTANFVLTRNCNMDCLFCGVEHMSGRRTPDTSLEVMCQVLERLREGGILRINLFGGEPLFYRDFRPFVQYATDLGFYISGVTNGRLICNENIDFISTHIRAIGISLHGFSAFHDRITRRRGSFDLTLRLIDNLVARGKRVTINTTVTDSNHAQVGDFVEEIHTEHGVDVFALNRCIGSPSQELPHGFVPEDVSVSKKSLISTLYQLEAVSERNPELVARYAIHFPYCIVPDDKLLKFVGHCNVGTSYIGVDPAGNIQLCSYTRGVIGNVLRTPLKEIWRKAPELVSFRAEGWMPERCRACRFKTTCMAGCKMSRGAVNPTPDSLLEAQV